MAADGKKLIDRFTALKGASYNHRYLWEKMAPFVAPSRVGIVVQYPDGVKQTMGVYDSTSMMAAELSAQFIAGHIINPSQQWGGMSMAHPAVAGNHEVQEWLEESRDRMLANFASSLFYAEGPESMIDYIGFGTGFLLGEEAPMAPNLTQRGFRGFVWQAEKTGRFQIADGVDGLVDTAFREYKLTADVIQKRWKGRPLPQNIQTAIQGGKLDQQFTIVHCIVPRDKSDRLKGAGNLAMPWASVWVELTTKEVIFESGYRVFPAAVPRYHRTPGETLGRGRGQLAFPDTWSLNTAKEMGFEDWALKIRPPSMVRHNSVIGSLRLTPGAPTSINTHGGRIQDAIMPWQTGSNPQVSQIKEEELRKSIRQIFFVDQILAMMEVNKSEMTAFEFAKKIELLFRLMGPVYGRMEKEYLRRIWDIGFDIMFHAGAFSPPPPEVFETDGIIDVTFQNPIAKAQRSGDVEAITQAINDLTPLAQIFPDMLDRFDPDQLAEFVCDTRGVPAKVQRSDDNIKMVRAARQQQQQREQQLAETEQVAGAAGKAAPMVKAMAAHAPAGNA